MDQSEALTERTLRRDEKYTGRFLQVHEDQVVLPSGRTAQREVVEHGPGAAILALDGENRVLTVTQYRYVFGRPLLEIPAGKLEPGEDPAAGALRELREETGAEPEKFLPMGRILPAPGCYGEIIYLFLAQGVTMKEPQPDEDELLILERIPLDECVHRCLNGEIEDAKTIAAVLKAKLLLGL